MSDSQLKVYYTSVSSSTAIKNKQLRMQMILDSKKIPYQLIDIATEDGAKQTMRDGVGDEKALPPQIFKGDKYLGNFEQFDSAVEEEALNTFLEISS